MVLTGSDFLGKCWNTLYNVISGGVTDPVSRGGSRFIFADFPDIQEGKGTDFPGFPLITINNFQTNTNTLTFQNGVTTNSINSTIAIHTKGKAQMDTVASDVWDSINSKRGVLCQSGMHIPTLRPMGIDTIAYSRNNKVHSQMINFECEVNI